jgi:hypothetical protein
MKAQAARRLNFLFFVVKFVYFPYRHPILNRKILLVKVRGKFIRLCCRMSDGVAVIIC